MNNDIRNLLDIYNKRNYFYCNLIYIGIFKSKIEKRRMYRICMYSVIQCNVNDKVS